MNKKIWILLASVFLVLILVLGIQMLNSGPTTEPDQEQVNQTSSAVEETPKVNVTEENQPNLETLEIEAESPVEPADPAERPIEPDETSMEAEAPVEAPVETTETQPEPTTTETPATSGQKEPSPLFVTLSVSVKTLLDKKDVMNPEKWELVPKDGWIFPAQKVEFYEGESVFNVLLREMKKNKIHMEYVMTPIYNSNYIEGIGNLYEFDCGELSGWMYAVNDLAPSLGTSTYVLEDGDTVRLLYTCDLGRDLGFDFDE
ncbi:MAG: DUF4430 domain-containing protein [Gudongella sp.]|nr:DUF4430 domain-containing protein [Gudongella sp.]